MAERSFAKEVEALKLGDGETFRGEGILAVTKALLQSGVSYVGSYQGAPGSHLLDVIVDAEDLLANLGVHVLWQCSSARAPKHLHPRWRRHGHGGHGPRGVTLSGHRYYITLHEQCARWLPDPSQPARSETHRACERCRPYRRSDRDCCHGRA